MNATTKLTKHPSQAACGSRTVEECVPDTARLRRTWPDPGVPWVQSSARRHAIERPVSGVPRKKKLLQGTAKGQERLEEAERRTRAAKRIKVQFADIQVNPTSCSSASPSDAIARGDGASACNVVAGAVAQDAGDACAGNVARDAVGQDAGKRPSSREGLMRTEPVTVREKMTRSERNNSAVKCSEDQ